MRMVGPSPVLDDAAVERGVQHLRAFVKQRGLRSSDKRDAVARAVLRQPGHFSIDELIGELHGVMGSEAHAATVYRMLPLLLESGLLQMTLISNRDGARYERAFEREHHDHLVCTACGKLVEFQFEAIEVLQRDLAEKFGFQLTDHFHELLGICGDCRTPASVT